MTESEWLTYPHPNWLLAAARSIASLQSPRGRRKFRLFACACCRQIDRLFRIPAAHKALEAAEQFADGLIDKAALAAIRKQWKREMSAGRDHAMWAVTVLLDVESFAAASAVCDPAAQARAYAATNGVDGPECAAALDKARLAQCDLIRDIFGNPFRPVMLDPRWLSSTVLDLARTIYDDRVFERMPILGDALMDAGCDSEEIIKHCQGPGPHVRGCWVVDLILGKQ